MEELRPELTATTTFGTNLHTPLELVERRGGRFIPVANESRGEFYRLQTVSREMATRAILLTSTLVSTEGLIVPKPKQLDRITLDDTGCWTLPTYDDPKGRARYGILHVKGIRNPSGLAHRTMYQVFFGTESLPNREHDYLDHICENKQCCYPRHLERVTHNENTRRGRVRITDDQVAIDLTGLSPS